MKFTKLGFEKRVLNRPASLAISTNVLEALPGKLDIKRHSPSTLYIFLALVAILVSGAKPVGHEEHFCAIISNLCLHLWI